MSAESPRSGSTSAAPAAKARLTKAPRRRSRGLFGKSASGRASAVRSWRNSKRLVFEPLENRTLLSVTVTDLNNFITPGPTTSGSMVMSVAGLNYVSAAASGSTVVSANVTGLDTTGLSYFTAAVKVDGSSSPANTVYYTGSGVSSSETYRVSVPLSNLSEGHHTFEMDVTEYTSGGTPIDSGASGDPGQMNVLKWSASVFGPGFNLQGLDALAIDDGGATYVRSDGTMGYFTSAGSGTFTSRMARFTSSR